MRLGPYEVVSEIGRGGMGVVYKARSPRGDLVAIKVVLETDPQKLARFDRERRLLGLFTASEGFVPLLDAGSTPHGPFLVMPLIEGGTLRTRFEEGPLAVGEALRIAKALARAMAFAHEKGVVHRDLKPENVLFTRGADGDTPLVADLGLGKHFDRSAPGASQSVSLSLDSELRGTAGYMSPEQVENAKTAGPGSDVFALGAMLYEGLAGHPAFSGQTVLEVVRRVGSGDFEALEPDGDMPRWLVRTVERALAVDPGQRFEHAGAFLEALERGPTANRRGAVVAGGVLLVVAAGVAAVSWRAGTPTPTSDTLEPAAPVASAKLSTAPARRPVTDPAVIRMLEDLEARARVHLERRELATALELCDRGIALDPLRARLWSRRGTARLALGDEKGGLADLDHAIEIDPGYYGGWHNRGIARSERDPAGALADFTKAVELEPTDTFAWYSRGMLKVRGKDALGAVADLERAIALDPKLVRAYVLLGDAKVDLGDPKAAIVEFTKALELDPRNGPALNDRGAARLAAGDRAGAVADFIKHTEVDPKNKAAWLALARATIATDHARSRDAFGKVIELEPANLVAHSSRAFCNLQLGDLDGALADFTRVIELDGRSASHWANRATVLAARHEWAGAIADCDKAIALDATSPSAWRERARARRSLGDRKGAREDLDRAIELAPKMASFFYARGEARAEDGNDDGALADFKRVVELAPKERQAAAARIEIERLERRRAAR